MFKNGIEKSWNGKNKIKEINWIEFLACNGTTIFEQE